MKKLFAVAAPPESELQLSTDKSAQLGVKFWNMHVERIESLKKLMQVPGENEATFFVDTQKLQCFYFYSILHCALWFYSRTIAIHLYH